MLRLAGLVLWVGTAACSALFPFDPADGGATPPGRDAAIGREAGVDSGDVRDAGADGTSDLLDAGPCGTPAVETHPMNTPVRAIARFGVQFLLGDSVGARLVNTIDDAPCGPSGSWELGDVRWLSVDERFVAFAILAEGTNRLAHFGPTCEGNHSNAWFGGPDDYTDVRPASPGSVAFLAAGTSGLIEVLDLEASPHTETRYAEGATVERLAVTPSDVYATVPSVPGILRYVRSTTDYTAHPTPGHVPVDIAFEADQVYVAADAIPAEQIPAYLTVYDENVQFAVEVPLDGHPSFLAVDRGFAFVCGKRGETPTLWALEPRANEPMVFTVALTSDCHGLFASDQYVYLADGISVDVVARGCAVPGAR